MSKLWTSMVLAVLYSAQLCADTAPAPTIGGTLSVNSFNVEWESWVESALVRSSSSYQSSEASEIMHLKVLFDLHHSDSSPLNGSGNGELIFVYRLEDFPWFPIKTLSLSLRSLEYQFQYPRSCLELPESWLKGSGGHTTARGAAESSQQQQQPVARYNENLGNFKCRRNIRKVL